MDVLDCLASMAFGFSPPNALPFFFMALGGLTDTATKVVAVTVTQIAAPRALHGRVFSPFESGLLGAQAFGGIVVGPLVVLFGPRYATFWLSAVGLVGLAITLPWLLRMEHAYGIRIFLRNVPVLRRRAARCSTTWRAGLLKSSTRPGRQSSRRGTLVTGSTL
jgi:hypothetical protein